MSRYYASLFPILGSDEMGQVGLFSIVKWACFRLTKTSPVA